VYAWLCNFCQGKDLFKIARPQARRLRTEVHYAKRNYEALLLEQAENHKIIQKSHNLYRTASFPLTPAQQAEFETIDRVKSDAMLHAEKNCAKFWMGKINFSLDISKAQGQRLCWQMVVWNWSGHNLKSNPIRCLAKAISILNPLHHAVTLWDAQQSFKATDEAYQLMKPNAPMMGIDFHHD
jgi:hypothetical protein